MSDDTTGPTAPRRPAPSPFCLAVAAELGLDPEQVIDGTMRVEWQHDTGLAGCRARVTWDAYLTEDAMNRIRRKVGEERTTTTTTTDAIPAATTTKRGADEDE